MQTLRKDLGQAAAVVAAGILTHANGFAGGFQFDDRAVILADDRLASLGNFTAAIPHAIRPLLKLTFFVDRHLYGGNPAGYHLLNVLLHCASALLVLAALSLLARRLRGDSHSLGWVPFCTAFLFAVHPIASETVTYLSGRATGLASFLVLLSLCLALAALARDVSRATFLVRGAAAVAAFGLALLAKETALVAPALLWLCLVVTAPGEVGRRERVLAGALAIVAGGAIAVAALHPRYVVLARASLETRAIGENVLTQVHAVRYALSLFVAPWRLNFDHDLPVCPSLTQPPMPADLGVLAALAVLAAWCARRTPLVTLGLAWFALCLLPTNSVIPRYDILSERNLYLPSVGLILAAVALAAAAVRRCPAKWQKAASVAGTAAFAAAALWMGTATIARNRVYFDEVTFWTDAARKSPQKARPHANLGYALMKTGELDRAIGEFRVALALEPDNLAASANLRRAWLARRER